MIRALDPQTAGRSERAVEMTQVNRTDRGQLMDDHVRLRMGYGVRDLIGVKRVRDHRHCAELSQHRLL
jgi:hypothetical protein